MSQLQPKFLLSLAGEIEDQGHRLTGARRLLINAIAAKNGHFTAEEMAHELRGVGRATVYRTIKLLLEMGLICRVLLEDGRSCYRLSPRGHHHHLVCVTCGSMRDFDECSVNILLESLTRETSFNIVGHWLEIYGQCERCRLDQSVASTT